MESIIHQDERIPISMPIKGEDKKQKKIDNQQIQQIKNESK